MHFSDLLEQKIREKGSPICVGYDPRLSKFPDSFKEKYDNNIPVIIEEFGKILIDEVHDLAPVMKFQWAFFFKYGLEGLQTLRTLLKYAKSQGMLTIVDAKVGDIGSTSKAYAHGFLHPEAEFGQYSDALTINPYLGTDSMEPFVNLANAYDKGLFILLKTSNPGSKDIQDITCERGTVYMHVAHMIDELGLKDIGDNNISNVGAVVGATYPEHAAILREKMPKTWFLVPGYGAQGGTIDTIKPAFMANGLGALIVAARSINYAYLEKKYKGLEFNEAIRKAAEDMYAELLVMKVEEA